MLWTPALSHELRTVLSTGFSLSSTAQILEFVGSTNAVLLYLGLLLSQTFETVQLSVPAPSPLHKAWIISRISQFIDIFIAGWLDRVFGFFFKIPNEIWFNASESPNAALSGDLAGGSRIHNADLRRQKSALRDGRSERTRHPCSSVTSFFNM